MGIAAVILAAGSSSRFGSPKQVVRIGGRTMVDTVVAVARDAGLSPIVAVVPPSVELPADVIRVVNGEPERGLSHSLRLALAAVPPETDAAVILLGDQPTIDPDAILTVVAAVGARRPIVATVADGHPGPPVLLAREAFGLAAEVTGDAGLRAFLAARPDLVTTVNVAAHAPDIDTLADLDAIAPACPGCGARLGAPAGSPTHPYIGASVGCWLRWSELLVTTGIGWMGRHANDAYASQHPGIDGRRQRQSVAVHLIALCQWLEHGVEDPQLTDLTRLALDGRPDWPWLEPPRAYELTVHDLPLPASAVDGRRWAASVWEAWTAHHPTVRRWSAALVAGRRPR